MSDRLNQAKLNLYAALVREAFALGQCVGYQEGRRAFSESVIALERRQAEKRIEQICTMIQSDQYPVQKGGVLFRSR